jgi:hypothetical protein
VVRDVYGVPMKTILNLIGYFRRAFASQRSTRIAWIMITILSAALVIEYADRLL